MMFRNTFEELYGKYRKHPKAVQSGFDGLPILEPGKFYLVFHQNEDRNRYIYKGVQLIKVETKATHHGEYKISYGTTSLCHDKSGCMYPGFIYLWFNRGMNCIVELPEEQQHAYRHLYETIHSQAGCENRQKLSGRFPEVWKL